MGFMDKVKAQATVLADKAQTGVQQGQVKIQELQSGKQVDHLLRELGASVFLSERGRTPTASEEQVAGIMAQLDALEAAGTAVTLAADAAPQGGGAVPPSGDGSVPPAASPVPPAPAAGGQPPASGAIPQSGDRLPGQ